MEMQCWRPALPKLLHFYIISFTINYTIISKISEWHGRCPLDIRQRLHTRAMKSARRKVGASPKGRIGKKNLPLIRFSLTVSVYLWNVEIAISRVIAAGASNPILCNDLARCTYLLQICDHKWRNKHKNTKQFFQFCAWSSLNLRLLSTDRNLNIKWLNISLGPLFWRSIVKLYLQWDA